MKHVRSYACNKFGHIAKECMRKFWPPYQREKTSSHLNIWKKKEAQLERCGIAEYTDMTDLEETGSVEHLCSKSHEDKSRIYASYTLHSRVYDVLKKSSSTKV